ncbi:hypothetical protein SAMN05216223_1363 [Actinacidiphila yanglinensis]|uniref:Uncharacterized protein n=1 Tax=Actinacidiphila yanglinensis TaxID=310779 RepID=A0A1H6EGB6_9ACTN|nr:hypothetical protein [Actinacidiphila yanglinensis]SEG95989.1 hypothetical protein SAMN05216223_1363 [Actinacidiphila yanglinensis]
MKTTLMFRQMIANPRRTTLAHLKDASELAGSPVVQDAAAVAPAESEAPALPQRTANPRRTVLNELPQTSVAS